MPPLNTPPRRRNAQVRTYWRLLQYAIKQHTTTDATAARDCYKKLQQANAQLTANPRDNLDGLDVAALVRTTHKLLGLADDSLLEPKGTSDA